MHSISVIKNIHRNSVLAQGKWMPALLHSKANLFSHEDCPKRTRGICIWNSFLGHSHARREQADVPLCFSLFPSSNDPMLLKKNLPQEQETILHSTTLWKENLSRTVFNKTLSSINTYRNGVVNISPLHHHIQRRSSNQLLCQWNCHSKASQKELSKNACLLDRFSKSFLVVYASIPLKTQQRRAFSSSLTYFKTDTDVSATATKVIDWNLTPKSQLLNAQHKIVDAKTKLKDAKLNLLEDIHDTRIIMKEKMGEIIERENIFTIPNLLCVFRIIAAPFLCHLVLIGNYPYALALFLFAGVTDLADGWIARMFPSQASKLGSFLDPLADKILVALLFLSLTFNGMIPVALTGLIIYRDVAIIAAASYLRYSSLPAPRTVQRYFDATHATIQLAPTSISKLNTAMQLTLITAALATPVFAFPSPEVTTALWGMTIGTTLASGLSYIFSDNTYKMLGELKEEQRLQEERRRINDSEHNHQQQDEQQQHINHSEQQKR